MTSATGKGRARGGRGGEGRGQGQWIQWRNGASKTGRDPMSPDMESPQATESSLARGDSFLPTFSLECMGSAPKRSVSFSSVQRQPSLTHSKSLGKVLHFDDQTGEVSALAG